MRPLFIVTLITFIGCGGAKFAEVTGTVTLDGKPLPKAYIDFCPDEPSHVLACGGTDASGKYVLYYADNRPGAVPGNYKVCVRTGKPQDNIPETVPEKYVKPETTDILKTVAAGKNVINLELKSK